MWIRRKRDSQKQTVYDAEGICKIRVREQFPDVYSIMSLEEIEAYCQKLINSVWFQRRWPQVKGTKLGDGGRRKSASGGLSGRDARMKFPKHTRYKVMILHELSHACDLSHSGWHGRPFCRIFLELLRHELGDEVWKTMKECFKEKRVKVKVATRRPDLFGKRPLGFDKMIAAKKKNQK